MVAGGIIELPTRGLSTVKIVIYVVF